MAFKDTLENMLNDMKNYHRDKNSLLIYYINKRLNESLNIYYKELENSITYLSSKNDMKVLKKMNK